LYATRSRSDLEEGYLQYLFVAKHPLVLEIVDSKATVKRPLPFLDEVIGEGLVTMKMVRVIRKGGAT
jgi:PII-like signaling protein